MARKGKFGPESTPSISAWCKKADNSILAVKRSVDQLLAVGSLPVQAIEQDAALIRQAIAQSEGQPELTDRLQAALDGILLCRYIQPQVLCLASRPDGTWGAQVSEGLAADSQFPAYARLAQKAFQVCLMGLATQAGQAAVRRFGEGVPSLDDVELRNDGIVVASVAAAPRLPPSKQLRKLLQQLWKAGLQPTLQAEGEKFVSVLPWQVLIPPPSSCRPMCQLLDSRVGGTGGLCLHISGSTLLAVVHSECRACGCWEGCCQSCLQMFPTLCCPLQACCNTSVIITALVRAK
jgi:hypothetical protein